MGKNKYNFIIITILITIATSYYIGWDYLQFNKGQYISQGILTAIFMVSVITLLVKRFHKKKAIDVNKGSPGLVELHNSMNYIQGDKMEENNKVKNAIEQGVYIPSETINRPIEPIMPVVQQPIQQPIVPAVQQPIRQPDMVQAAPTFTLPGTITKQPSADPIMVKKSDELFGAMTQDKPVQQEINIGSPDNTDPIDEIKKLEEHIKGSIEKVNKSIMDVEREVDDIKLNIVKPLSIKYNDLWDKKKKLEAMLKPKN